MRLGSERRNPAAALTVGLRPGVSTGRGMDIQTKARMEVTGKAASKAASALCRLAISEIL